MGKTGLTMGLRCNDLNFTCCLSQYAKFPKNSPVDQTDETVESDRRDRAALRERGFLYLV
jgi:hypothetical protein